MKQLQLSMPDTNARSIAVARAERDAAIALVALNAAALAPEFSPSAMAFVAAYAMRHARFSSEDLVDAYNATSLPRPHDDRAWGSIFRSSMKNGTIRRTNEVCQRRKGHAAPTLLWESVNAI